MDSEPDNGIGRTVGRRKTPEPGVRLPEPLGQDIQRWITSTHQLLCWRVPKGVFRYRTHEEANADWEKWMAETIVATIRARETLEIEKSHGSE